MASARQRTLRLELPAPDEDSLVLDTRSTPGLIVSQSSQRENGHIVLVLEELTLHAVQETEGMPGFVGDWPDPGQETTEPPRRLKDLPPIERWEGSEAQKAVLNRAEVEEAATQARRELDTPLAKAFFETAQARRELPVVDDPWAHRSEGMRCSTCMFYVKKVDGGQHERPSGVIAVTFEKGRCRRHAPTMGGYPVVFPTDWCGDHKLK